MTLAYVDATVGYGRAPVVRGATFAVSPGEAVGLLGSNGAGKSTLLKAALGLSDVLSGRVRVDGSVGYVPQHSDAAPEFPITAEAVVGLGLVPQLRPFRRIGREGRRLSREALERVGLADRARTRFGDMSGGQRQRVLLARALVARPRALLLDEPFNGLDRASRDRLVETILDLKAQGMAVLLTTHDLRLSEDTCERTLTVVDGGVRR
ncbi:metal ABC transporter ATP-binding protein [Corynebacterium timonense]|uniref:Manganese/iron transport system ATP-binding protein n=1 Tax=Corynebacterium timonense TaxID=441500 RepID=A0A1H1LKT6_9CORY|nr:ABC transporter ATP-binding protein [Corynebacterium timonense]SDR74479.1 manganese/iron transport system ATP-binding protein [Corynebacterium timonense]